MPVLFDTFFRPIDVIFPLQKESEKLNSTSQPGARSAAAHEISLVPRMESAQLHWKNKRAVLHFSWSVTHGPLLKSVKFTHLKSVTTEN